MSRELCLRFLIKVLVPVLENLEFFFFYKIAKKLPILGDRIKTKI